MLTPSQTNQNQHAHKHAHTHSICQIGVGNLFVRLLDWIDRVDRASQTGGPKPPFQTEDGQSIFPEGDELWWLTDISRRAPADDEEKAEGDEDGPPSDIDVEEQQQEVSDDDPVSDADLVPPDSVRAHEPVVAWRH